MKRRNVLTVVSLFILPLLLFHFQNCAPASPSSENQSATPVRLIEDLNKAQIQFVANDVEVKDDVDAAGVDGLCNRDHDGATLNWSISSGGSPLMRGTSACAHGQFSISVAQLEQLVCGVSHLLVVEGAWGGSTFTHVTRRCQPLSSQAVAAPEGSPMGTECSLEYSPASAADNPCVQVCYRASKVVWLQPLELTRCSSLAAQLAGP